jgi:hypothetical protein
MEPAGSNCIVHGSRVCLARGGGSRFKQADERCPAVDDGQSTTDTIRRLAR